MSGKSDLIARLAAAWPVTRGHKRRLLVVTATAESAERMREAITRHGSGAWPIGVTVDPLNKK